MVYFISVIGTGKCTKIMIPNFRPWVERKHEELNNYYKTQLFTEHREFGMYMI